MAGPPASAEVRMRGGQSDEALFKGSAPYYEQGRLPYPAGLADTLAAALQLDGQGRLIDVGCGPGILALRFATLFTEVVGLDPDTDMLAEAERRAAELGVANARWVRARAEDLPADLGTFRVASFGRSFHWMDQDRVATVLLTMLEPGGAFVEVSQLGRWREPDPDASLPYPRPPRSAIFELGRAYLGGERRQGRNRWQGGRRDAEATVLARAGYAEPVYVEVPGGVLLTRTADDLVADVFSHSTAAPHLFGERVGQFETELRALLVSASPSGLFTERTPNVELRIWRTPLC